MKKYFYLLVVSLCFGLVSCSDDDPSGDSIFDTNPPIRNALDTWILENITKPFNMDIKYKFEDIQSDMTYTLSPASYEQSLAMSKLIKFLWLDPYVDVAGEDFIKKNTPRLILLIGSPAYNSDNTVTLGVAEGGVKVTLNNLEKLDYKNPNGAILNEQYFKTMHHEFTHILNQTKDYNVDFDKISFGKYVSGNWYQHTDLAARKKGFITSYAMSEAREDFAELYSVYVTSSSARWSTLIASAGEEGGGIILQKMEMVSSYLLTAWKINIDDLRDNVLERTKKVSDLDLTNL